MTTTKYFFDESSHALHRVVGYTHTWEELGHGVRVRRRSVKPPQTAVDVETWHVSTRIDASGNLTIER